MSNPMENVIADKIAVAVQNVEEQVDDQLDRLRNLDLDDLEKLRQDRLMQLKKESKQQLEWRANGHGEYTEVAGEKELFNTCKKSKTVICHFYRDETFRCKIIDKHLQLLASKHVESKFIKINAPKCLFVAVRLKVKVLPCIMAFRDGTCIDRIVGFTDLGNRDDFPTEMLEWRLAKCDAIEYTGDKAVPPTGKSKTPSVRVHKSIRGTTLDDDDSDEDLIPVTNPTGPFLTGERERETSITPNSGKYALVLTDEEEASLREVTDDL